ncbi:unnamed protein product [Vitrella brassicaformis CCMP3155]|uniref:START domain-containing protein n=2 Tax=Vitrella brassicaformis TaxID=1169539 RepID=A0A0G4EQG7_VITBC|nr:unnamed protein product [Vitrella brassicaformis CCMP3155]|mmetsp:Transcript_52299/g.131435  ORF Transcript_52299/g.131435 Transcript_52299/m.131435 type:complete len:623 (+) Transcript_52299:131-1999(+)|eukprot:CEM00045.1 unnamed protein product [Vitrella brassicaformis CCMP3155]
MDDAQLRSFCRDTAQAHCERADELLSSTEGWVNNGILQGIQTERLDVPDLPPIFRGSIDIPCGDGGVTFEAAFDYMQHNLERRKEIDPMAEDMLVLSHYEGDAVIAYQSFKGMLSFPGRDFVTVAFHKSKSPTHVIMATGGIDCLAPALLNTFTQDNEDGGSDSDSTRAIDVASLTAHIESLLASKDEGDTAGLMERVATRHRGHIYIAAYAIQVLDDQPRPTLRMSAVSQTDLGGNLSQMIQRMVTTNHITTLPKIAKVLRQQAEREREDDESDYESDEEVDAGAGRDENENNKGDEAPTPTTLSTRENGETPSVESGTEGEGSPSAGKEAPPASHTTPAKGPASCNMAADSADESLTLQPGQEAAAQALKEEIDCVVARVAALMDSKSDEVRWRTAGSPSGVQTVQLESCSRPDAAASSTVLDGSADVSCLPLFKGSMDFGSVKGGDIAAFLRAPDFKKHYDQQFLAGEVLFDFSVANGRVTYQAFKGMMGRPGREFIVMGGRRQVSPTRLVLAAKSLLMPAPDEQPTTGTLQPLVELVRGVELPPPPPNTELIRGHTELSAYVIDDTGNGRTTVTMLSQAYFGHDLKNTPFIARQLAISQVGHLAKIKKYLIHALTGTE